MKCEYCDIIDRKSKGQILYQDEEIVVALKDTAVIPGQLTVFPKKHLTIMELVPNDLLKKCAVIANKAGVAVFEALGAEGTNIVIQNGLGAGQKVPHFAVEVLPRRQEDGLNFQWTPKQLEEDEVDLVYKLLKDEAEKINLAEEEKKEKTVVVKDEKTEMKVEQTDKDNYLLKSLRRVP